MTLCVTCQLLVENGGAQGKVAYIDTGVGWRRIVDLPTIYAQAPFTDSPASPLTYALQREPSGPRGSRRLQRATTWTLILCSVRARILWVQRDNLFSRGPSEISVLYILLISKT